MADTKQRNAPVWKNPLEKLCAREQQDLDDRAAEPLRSVSMCYPANCLEALSPMAGNLLLKKVAMNVPMTAHEIPRKYARIVSIGTVELSKISAVARTPG